MHTLPFLVSLFATLFVIQPGLSTTPIKKTNQRITYIQTNQLQTNNKNPKDKSKDTTVKATEISASRIATLYDFLQNITTFHLYDEESKANYLLIRINKTSYLGRDFSPKVVSTESTTAWLMNQGLTYNLVINGGIFDITKAQSDGLLIIDGEVLQEGPTVTHPKCQPLTIDANGDLFYAEWNVKGNDMIKKGIRYAITGFMPIIIDFKKVPTSLWNRVEHYTANAQRQIIGQFDNGDYGILTSEGRGAVNSDGLTIEEAQNLCIKHGFKFAYNLDGGGSTETVIGRKMMNHIYDGESGRKVPNFIVW